MVRDCCQDKASPYDISLAEADLFRAAIGLAEQLLEQDVNDLQREAITAMLAFLRNLPAPPPAGFNGEFGFEFQQKSAESDGSQAGAWVVCVYRGLFELFSSGCEPLLAFSWELCPGKPIRMI